jgi:hypothetical protein
MVLDSKQGKNWMATDLRISVPVADCHLLPSTGICCSAAARDAWDTGQLTADRTLPPYST